ncbi:MULTISPECIES: ribonuclease inhibitor [unclassified Microbacterium]|uniref:ribonuclease inhibitor n=1 Tax=unclassified Microbacterium TaxID=2609290 RepID=UPI0038633313
MAVYVIEGSRVDGIAGFYDELNRLFMSDEDWRLGESLDALDDLLYGGIGALDGDADVRVEWADHELSRAALGPSATDAWLSAKLARPDLYRSPTIEAQLTALRQGRGPTYFELVLDVFAGHPQVQLSLR